MGPRDLGAARAAAGLAASANSAAFLLGFSASQWGPVALPLDLGTLGLPGCRLAVAPEFVALEPAGGATAVHAFTVPTEQALLGIAFFAQVLAADPAVQPAGLALGDAIRAVVGGR